jgi:flagellar motor switch protein FliM
MSKVLSQEEVDALLSGISGGEVETETDKPPDNSSVRPFNFSDPEKKVHGRMPALELMGERFVRSLRTSVSSSLRKPAGAKIVSHEIMKYADFIRAVSLPSSMHIVRMDPLRGSMLVLLDASLVFGVVDILFGGNGKGHFQVEGREFTTIENRIIKRMVDLILNDLKEAWKSIKPVSLTWLRTEINPQFITIIANDDLVLVTTLELEIDGSAGKVMFCYPYSILEPIKDKLQGYVQVDQPDEDGIWTENMRRQLLGVPVNVVVELGTAMISGKELLNLSAGDVIQLDTYSKEKLRVKVENVIKFVGYPGFYRGNQALQISNVYDRRY